MKREIKFRGQQVDNGEWVYGDYHHRAGGVKCIIRMEPDDNGKAVYIVHQVNPDTVGQFTGLLDKNGKEIYFDDIVRNKYGDIGCVIWFPDWSLRVDWGGGDIHFIDPEWGLEVIGNIHDNPELLHTKSE